MVTLKGPSISLSCRGALADAITFNKTKRGTSAKKQSSPAQPRTGPQISVRAMMRFLSQWWTTCTTPEKESWTMLAEVDDIAPYHAFIRTNMFRWNNFWTPTKAYPAAAILVPTSPSDNLGHADVASAHMSQHFYFPSDNIGAVWYRDTVPAFPLTSDRVVFVQHRLMTKPWGRWRDTPLSPGTYYYVSFNFTIDGNWGTPSPYRPITIT